MNKKKNTLFVIFCLATVALFAQSNRPNYDFMKEQVDYWGLWWQNPAMRFYYPTQHFTDVSLSVSLSNQSVYNPQKGNKSSSILFAAKSFTKQKQQLFYGAANYSNGIQKNIKWNTLTDVDQLYPYIVADTITDKMYKEQYYFSGGYAYQFQKVAVGVFADYTAANAYDRIDPRPNNTVSNLQVVTGISTNILPNYSVGVNLRFNKYQQDQSLSIYKNDNAAAVYYLRGFGVADRDFSSVITKTNGGADNMYKQKEYELAAQIYPAKGKGFFLALSTIKNKLELKTGNLNQTVVTLQSRREKIALGYQFSRNYNIKLWAELSSNEGVEYIYKNRTNLINKVKKYKRDGTLLGVDFAGRINYSNQLKSNFIVGINYSNDNQQYIRIGSVIANEKKIDNLMFHISKNLLKMAEKSSWLIKLGLVYRDNIDKELKSGYLATKNAIAGLVEPIYRYETENYLAAELGFRYDYFIDAKYSAYIKANTSYTYFKSNDNNQFYRIGVGLSF